MLAILLGLLPGVAGATSDETAHIEFHGNTYSYAFSAVLDAPRAAVRAVVTDYGNLARLNDSITASRVLVRQGPGRLERLLALRQCVLLFCFDITFVEQVEEYDDRIVTTVLPARSSFRDGHAEWRLQALAGDRTRLGIEATQTPDFWIPPLLGPLVLKRVFLAEVRETTANIERLARRRAAGKDS